MPQKATQTKAGAIYVTPAAEPQTDTKQDTDQTIQAQPSATSPYSPADGVAEHTVVLDALTQFPAATDAATDQEHDDMSAMPLSAVATPEASTGLSTGGSTAESSADEPSSIADTPAQQHIETIDKTVAEVRESAEAADKAARELQQKTEEAQKQLDQAKQEVDSLQQKLDGGSGSTSKGPTIAGYPVAELAKVFVKPPTAAQPASPAPPDDGTKQQLEEAKKKVEQAQKQLKAMRKEAGHFTNKEEESLKKLAEV